MLIVLACCAVLSQVEHCLQMAVVLEYMDGGTLADLLKKVSYMPCQAT
jgi:hypothetical protein